VLKWRLSWVADSMNLCVGQPEDRALRLGTAMRATATLAPAALGGGGSCICVYTTTGGGELAWMWGQSRM